MELRDLIRINEGMLPDLIGIEFEDSEPGAGVVHAKLDVEKKHLAGNGYLHAAAVVALADTACGYGCLINAPEGVTGFTTIELKTNFLRTTRSGTITCEARAVHGGRTTQVWDATVSTPDDKPMALFRCTQMLLRG
jgi:1,4-dihydroxy-2-naphthoyl-CoA hydrolase